MHSFGLFLAMSVTDKVTNILQQDYATVLNHVALRLKGDQQQALRFYYSRFGLISVEDTGILTTLTSLEEAGMISWEDVGSLTEGLRQIKRLDLVKLLTKFEMKRNLTVLLDLYARKRLGLDLSFRSDSVRATAAYLTETVRDGFDITIIRSLVESGENIKKILNEFEDEMYRSECSSPWSKLTMLIVIAGEIIVAASANGGKRHHNHQLMEMCHTAAEECSSRMIELGTWVS